MEGPTAQIHSHIFIPQLANIEAAFQNYLLVLAEVKTAFECGVEPGDVDRLRMKAAKAREDYFNQHLCLSMLVLALVQQND